MIGYLIDAALLVIILWQWYKIEQNAEVAGVLTAYIRKVDDVRATEIISKAQEGMIKDKVEEFFSDEVD